MNLATGVVVGVKGAKVEENGCTIKEASKIDRINYCKKIIEFPLLVENNVSTHKF